MIAYFHLQETSTFTQLWLLNVYLSFFFFSIINSLRVLAAILIQGDVNKDFIGEFCSKLKVDLSVSWTNVYDVNALTRGLKSLTPDDLAENGSLSAATNLFAGKLLLYLTGVILNPFHYKVIILDQDPLTVLELELFRMYKEPPKKSLLGKFIICGAGAQRAGAGDSNKPGIEELIEQVLDQLKKYYYLSQNTIKNQVNIEKTGVRYNFSLLTSALEIFAAPNKFLMSVDKKGRSKLTSIANSLVLFFTKNINMIQDYLFEYPQLLKLFAQFLSNYPFVLHTLPKLALVELVQQYSKLFFRLITSKSPSTNLESEYDQAVTNAIGSFLLVLASLPAAEVREEIIKGVFMPELSSPQVFEEQKRAIKLHFTLAFAHICFNFQSPGNINLKAKITFPVKNMATFLKLSTPSLVTLPLATKLSQESSVVRDIMLENGFLTESTSSTLAPAKIWSLSASNGAVFEYFLNISTVLAIFMEIPNPEIRNKLVIGLLGAVQNAAEGLDVNLAIDYKYCIQELGNTRLLFSKLFYNCFFKDCYLLLLKRAIDTAKSWPENKGDMIAQSVQQHTALAWDYILRLPLFLVRKMAFESLSTLFRYCSNQEKFDFLWKIYQNSKLESLQADVIISCFTNLRIDPKSNSIDFTSSLYHWIEANKSTASDAYESYLRFFAFFAFCETVKHSLSLEKVSEIALCCTSEDFIRFYEHKLDLLTVLPKYIALLDEINAKIQNLFIENDPIEEVRNHVKSFTQYLLRFIIVKSRFGDTSALKPYFDLWKGRTSKFLKIQALESPTDLVSIQTDMLVFEILVLESADQSELITLFGKYRCLRYLNDTISVLLKLYRNADSEINLNRIVLQVIQKSIIKGVLKLLLKANISDLNSISHVELEKSPELEKHWQSYVENVLIFISSCLSLVFKPAENNDGNSESAIAVQKLFALWSELSIQFLQKTFVPLLNGTEELKIQAKKSTSEKNLEFLASNSKNFLASNLRQFIKEEFTPNSQNLIYLAKEQRANFCQALVLIADLLKDDNIYSAWELELKEGCKFLQSYLEADSFKPNELNELQQKLQYWFELAARVKETEIKIGFWAESLTLAIRLLSLNAFSKDRALESFGHNLILVVLNESINAIKTMSKDQFFTQKYNKELKTLLDLALQYYKTVILDKIKKGESLDSVQQSTAVVLKILSIFTVLALEHGFDFKFETLFKEYDLLELQGTGEDHCIIYIIAAILKNNHSLQLSLEQIIDAKVFKYNNLYSILSDSYLLKLFDIGILTEEILSSILTDRYELVPSENFSKSTSLTQFDLMKVTLASRQGSSNCL